MTDKEACPRCGRPIPSDAPNGMCPYCLISEVVRPSQTAPKLAANRDANLLFALFAHLLKHIEAEQFADVVSEWVENPSVLIADRLVEQGILSAASQKYIEGLISDTVKFHGGNVTKALETLGGRDRVAKLLTGSGHRAARELLDTKLALSVSEEMLMTESAPESAVEEKAGRYTGSSEYSRGGMGRILLVHDELLGRDIVLKELLPLSDSAEDPHGEDASPMRASASLLARFLREARITGRLEHPSIVPVYELGRRANGSLYYTMRLVRGKTLRTVLEESKTLEDRLKLLPNFVDLCMGLAYAHSKGVVHRDIKPSNVMIGEFGETVIIDWGLAKVVDGDETIDDTLHRQHGSESVTPDKSVTGEILGSPHYMSPEQALGKINEIDARTDVFSLGVLLYEILANQTAFGQSSLEALVEHICNEEPTPISDYERHVPEELISVCRRAMQKEKGDRYPSAKALGDDVSRFLAGSIVSAYNYRLTERLRRFYDRRKSVVNIAAAALFVVVSTVVVAFLRIDYSRDLAIAAKERESAALEIAETARDAEAGARRNAEAKGYHNAVLLTSEFVKDRNADAARNALWSTSPEHRGWEAEFLRHRVYDERYSVSGYTGIAVQANGAVAAYFYRDNPILLQDIETAERIALLNVPPRVFIDHVALSPNGVYLAAAAANGVVHVWDLASGLKLYATSATPRAKSVTFSEDGEFILVGTDDGTAQIWASETGAQSSSLTSLGESVRRASYSPSQSFVFALVDDVTWEVWDLVRKDQVIAVPGTWASMSSADHLAVISEGTLTVRNARDRFQAALIIEHSAPFREVRFRPGGNQLVALSSDGDVGLWDADSGMRVRQFWDNKQIDGFALSSDGDLMTTWNLNNTLTIWELSTGSRVRIASGMSSYIFRQYAQFSDDGRYFLASMNPPEGPVSSVWESTTAVPRLARQVHGNGIVPGIAMSRDEGRAAFLTKESVLLFHDIGGTAPDIGIFTAGSPQRLRATFAASADEIVFSGDAFTPLAVNLSTGTVRAAFYGHADRVTDIDSHPTRDEIATGCADTRVRIWRGSTGEMLLELPQHSGPVTVVRYRSDGNALFTADDQGEVRLWDPSSGVVLAQAQLGSGVVTAEWSPGSDSLAVGMSNGSIALLEASSFDVVQVIEGARTAIESLAFMGPERLVTADSTGLRLWNILRGHETLAIVDPISASSDVRTVLDGRALLTRCMDGTLRVWDPEPWDSGLDRTQFERQRTGVPAPALSNSIHPLPSRTIVVTTAEHLLESLRNLLNALTREEPVVTDDGLVVSGVDLEYAVSPLGLLPGDTLAALRRSEILTSEDAIGELTNLIAELEATPTGVPIRMRVLRAEDISSFEIAYVALRSISTTTAITPAEALDLLSISLIALETARDRLVEQSRRTARQRSDPGMGNAIPGLRLTAASAADRDRLRRLGLSSLDRILSVNGTEVTSVDVYEDALRNAFESVQSTSQARIVMVIERGSFQRIEHTIEIG